ncbi:hypothetical protein [Pacificoceanicola onchidii]|uniref:hypothetical protein n=1 Tax=Pacificoceanicola onchidii TaxID=2562685 RepID=UPI0010A61A3E|nr:hypothetical protein [Pacificoceanicola onchidii]
MNSFEYAPRKVSFLGTHEIGDHRLKVYSLIAPSYGNPPVPSTEKIKELLGKGLPDPELEEDHKIGFGILHWAGDGLYTLTNTWYDANMLRLRAFLIDEFDSAEPKMESLDHLNVITCVWELEIYKYERDLWVRSVLEQKPAELTDAVLADYLSLGFEGYV